MEDEWIHLSTQRWSSHKSCAGGRGRSTVSCTRLTAERYDRWPESMCGSRSSGVPGTPAAIPSNRHYSWRTE